MVVVRDRATARAKRTLAAWFTASWLAKYRAHTFSDDDILANCFVYVFFRRGVVRFDPDCFLVVGTYRLRGDAVRQPLEWALRAGYRAVDSAAGYQNEEQVGQVLRDYSKANGNTAVFVTTKLSPREHGLERAYSAIVRSHGNLGLGAAPIDLVLVHWPGQYGIDGGSAENARLRAESWLALQRAQREGLVRHIGVSNYTIGHLEEIVASGQAKPSVNQVECHPLFPQRELKAYCDRHGIVLQAYASFGSDGSLIDHPLVVEAARLAGCKPNHVLLRWALDRGIPVIPKSAHRERIEDNLRVGTMEPLPAEATRLLDSIAKVEGERKLCWDPVAVK